MKMFLTLLFIIGCVKLYCQTFPVANPPNTYHELKVVSYDQAKWKDQRLQFISIGYLNEKAAYIKVFSDTTVLMNGFKENSKYFDLNFEGDLYIWNQYFKNIILPIPLKLSNQNQYEKKLASIYDIRRIDVYPDSTNYYYAVNSSIGKEEALWGFPAKYNGDIESIQSQISKMIKGDSRINRMDSIIVFEAIVGRDGNIRSCNLIGGKNSLFAEYVYNVITKLENTHFSNGQSKWRPAIVYSSGRPIETKIKLYAEFDESANVKIRLPKTLRNFTGN